MADLILPNNLSNGTVADAAQVMADLTAVKDHANTQTIHRDGSRTFTAYPSLPGTAPTNTTDAAPKGYVDAVGAASAAASIAKVVTTSWTPIVTQGSVVTQTSAVCVYKKYDDWFHVRGFITISGAGTIGNPITITGLPFNPTDLFETVCGTFRHFDSGTGYNNGVAFVTTGDAIQFQLGGTGTASAFGGTVALAATDTLSFSLWLQGV